MFDDVLDKLYDAGFEARGYRGRFMQKGRPCVATILDEIVDLTLLGRGLRRGIRVDNWGEQFVAYWPDALIEEDHPLMAKYREQFDEEPDPLTR